MKMPTFLKNIRTSLFANPVSLLASVALIIFISYYLILIIKEVKPLSQQEKVRRCLEFGSDRRANVCLQLLGGGLNYYGVKKILDKK